MRRLASFYVPVLFCLACGQTTVKDAKQRVDFPFEQDNFRNEYCFARAKSVEGFSLGRYLVAGELYLLGAQTIKPAENSDSDWDGINLVMYAPRVNGEVTAVAVTHEQTSIESDCGTQGLNLAGAKIDPNRKSFALLRSVELYSSPSLSKDPVCLLEAGEKIPAGSLIHLEKNTPAVQLAKDISTCPSGKYYVVHLPDIAELITK